MVSSVGGRKHSEHRVAITFQLGGADPLNLAEFEQIARLALGDLAKRGIVKYHIGRHPRLRCDAAALLAQGLEQGIGRSFLASAGGPPARRRYGDGELLLPLQDRPGSSAEAESAIGIGA